MDAEDTPAVARRSRATGAAVALLVAMQLWTAAASASGPGAGPAREPAATLDKPASVAKRAAPTHAWIEAGSRRSLTLDRTLRADFSPNAAAVLRAADGPLKDVPGALQSPVLRDETGQARALPGGVLLVTAAGLDAAATRALLARHGASAARPVADRLWLLPSPAGLESLELANRLAGTGEFVSAQPNWWMARTRK